MTANEVVAVLGPVDESVIAEVIAIGASAEDLAEAWAWLNSDETLISEGRPMPTGKVAELIDLLSSDQTSSESGL